MLRTTAAVLALAGCSSAGSPPGQAPATTDDRPTAVVAMGDSEATGVGGTAPGTRTGGSASCARSTTGGSTR